MAYDKEKWKKDKKEQVKSLKDSLKKLSNELITDTDKLKKLAESWSNQLYSYSAQNLFTANFQLIANKGRMVSALGSYKRWKDEERYVNKGEKALHILAPIFTKIKDKNGEEEKVISFFKTVPVFDISQTNGKACKYVSETNKLISETEFKFEDLKANCKCEVKLESLSYGGHTDGESITVNIDHTNEGKIANMFHELAHLESHYTKEGKELDRRTKELEAEAVSYLLCELIGIENKKSAVYINSWKGGAKELEKSGQRVLKTADKIAKYVFKGILN